MKLKLVSKAPIGDSTPGSLYVDCQFECNTIEDIVREVMGVPVEKWKIKGRTAIPSTKYNGGKLYKVVIDYSQRFERQMPHVLDVPGYAGIRFHPGNDAPNSEGCILPGTLNTNCTAILGGTSIPAYEKLFTKIAQALALNQEVTLEVIREEENGVAVTSAAAGA